MAEHPHLENAPIQEALIDLRVSLPADFDVEVFRAISQEVEGFPKVEASRRLQARLDFERPQMASEVTGRALNFQSLDGKQVAQLRTDGFTFNWLSPYRTWEDLLRQAEQFWRHYLRLAGPEEIRRVAVRYVNRFPVVLPVDTDEIFRIPLELPPGVDGTIADFLYRVTFRESAGHQRCNLTLTGERKAEPEEVDIIFDVDCFDVRHFRASDPAVWGEVLPRLRHFKNRIFFSGLTTQQIERFK